MRQYESIWEELKKNKIAVVKCRPAKIKTIIKAVKKEKSKENTIKKQLDLPHYGEMIIEPNMKHGRIKFTIPNEMVISVKGVTAGDL